MHRKKMFPEVEFEGRLLALLLLKKFVPSICKTKYATLYYESTGIGQIALQKICRSFIFVDQQGAIALRRADTNQLTMVQSQA